MTHVIKAINFFYSDCDETLVENASILRTYISHYYKIDLYNSNHNIEFYFSALQYTFILLPDFYVKTLPEHDTAFVCINDYIRYLDIVKEREPKMPSRLTDNMDLSLIITCTYTHTQTHTCTCFL